MQRVFFLQMFESKSNKQIEEKTQISVIVKMNKPTGVWLIFAGVHDKNMTEENK